MASAPYLPGVPFHHAPPSPPGRLVVLVSGTGTNLQALLDAADDPAFGAKVVAGGADRAAIPALGRAEAAGLPTFVRRVTEFADRADWDRALRDTVAKYSPDLVVLAGFMKLVGADFLAEFGGRVINTHPALLPSFPGMHGVRDALAYGVTVTGCTLFAVTAGTDDGPIIAQSAVVVEPDDDEASLHERIKTAEQKLLVEYTGRMARNGWTIGTDRKVSVS